MQERVAIVIDGWFMRKRIYKLKAFHYDGPEIRKYCLKHLRTDQKLYRIFYYDTKPLEKRGHNPISKKSIDFSKTTTAMSQNKLLDSLKSTPFVALRLGQTVWHKNWILQADKFKDLLNKSITVDDLKEADIRPVIEQKAVDMKLGLDIAHIAIRKLADILIAITADSDFVPVLKLARTEGMQVGLDPLWCNIRPELAEHVDFIKTHVLNPKAARAIACKTA